MPQELPLERQQPQDEYDKALADDYHDDRDDDDYNC